MLAVIAQCGDNYGVVDTKDNIVEWVTENNLYKYMINGTTIEGVSEDNGIVVNPLFYIRWDDLKFKVEDVRKGYNNRVEFYSDNNKYKLRLLMPISANTKVSLDEFSFVADVDGYLCKLTNGICTIIPTETFKSLFDGYIKY